jgi:class 3 adenylate cyclase
MTAGERHYRWEWALRASPAALWPRVADTNRFNRDAGVPAVQPAPGGGGDLENARRRLRLIRFGIPVEWEEEPFEWVWPSRFGVVRRYRSGPITELRVLVELSPRSPTGTTLVYQVWVRPRNLLGAVVVAVAIGRQAARQFEATIRRYDEEVLAEAGSATRSAGDRPPGPPTLPSAVPAPGPDRPAGSGAEEAGAVARSAALTTGGAARLEAAAAALRRDGSPPGLVARLVETVASADDMTLARLRPYVLADRWGAPRRAVLELCLLATRAGLLDLRWDLLCPLCRGAKASHARLDEIDPDVHCDTCRIDFRVDFDRSVELTFRPSPAVRRVETQAFCVGGPGVTPHVVAQQLLPAGFRRTVAIGLEPGRYRARALGRPGVRLLRVDPPGGTRPEAAGRESTDCPSPSGGDLRSSEAAPVDLTLSDEGWPEGELRIGPRSVLLLANQSREEALVLVEHREWADEAATAAEVTALQRFRDLFAAEALRPGEQIAVGSLAFLFTDLRGSTRLYRDVGDAPAFGRVMSHFDVLRRVVAEEGGAVVKTMGDAIMAAFPRPAAALRAALAAQRGLAAEAGAASLRLRAGVHAGPCIAVTQNERLDYFGSVVNIAARLEGFSEGGDVVVSAAVRSDPEVTEWLGRSDAGVVARPFEGTLKGFDTERFALWRVSPAPGADRPGNGVDRSGTPS